MVQVGGDERATARAVEADELDAAEARVGPVEVAADPVDRDAAQATRSRLTDLGEHQRRIHPQNDLFRSFKPTVIARFD